MGERRIIDIIASFLEKMPDMPVPFGDDVSAVNLDQNQAAVLKTDMLVGKTDVPSGMSLWQAARKAVVMNVSDFLAKRSTHRRSCFYRVCQQVLCKKTRRNRPRLKRRLIRQYGTYIIGGIQAKPRPRHLNLALWNRRKN